MEIKGIVNYGARVGVRLGFPTANIVIDRLVNIECGVYAVEVIIDGFIYNGMANVGYHPTVGLSKDKLLEVYIFGFNGFIYDKEILVKLLKYMRPECKFESEQKLIEAIKKDEKEILDFFNNGRV